MSNVTTWPKCQKFWGALRDLGDKKFSVPYIPNFFGALCALSVLHAKKL